MAAAPGMTDQDPHLEARQDMCRFADDRRSAADKLDFVHQILQGHTAEARLYLDRIQRLTTALDTQTRRAPAVAREIDAIARDGAARARAAADVVIDEVGLEDVEILGRITRYAIMAFVVILALAQMDIGGEILKNAFYIAFGAACFGAALAFGLGSQKWAGELLERFLQTRTRKKQS